jgi:MprA protease rhombosortase-interaction domain-containing protein
MLRFPTPSPPSPPPPPTPLHQTIAPDGYTYLEKYIHSLTPNAFPAAGTVSHTIGTAYGVGADAMVSENGGISATSGGNGEAATLDAVWGGASGSANQALLMRFDLSQVVPGSLTGARLDLTAASATTGTRTFMAYGLEQVAAGWDWEESSAQFNSAPGLAFDSNSQTLGIDNTFSATTHPDNPNVLNLGEVTVGAIAAGQTVSISNPNLAVFLNLAAYYQDATSKNAVTIILQQVTSASQMSFWSKEGNAALSPRLVIDAILQPVLSGDYDGNGFVDAADYVVWRRAMSAGGTLLNETASLGTADQADYDAWRANFGAGGTPGNGTLSGSGAVPEPATGVLLAVAGGAGFRLRRRRKVVRGCLRISGSFLQE